MERIKNLEQVVLAPNALLAEITEIKSSGIILPGAEETSDSLDYMRIVTTGSGVDDLKVGDIVLDMVAAEIPIYSINDTKYGILYRGNIRVAVKADNFDLSKEDKDSNLNV